MHVEPLPQPGASFPTRGDVVAVLVSFSYGSFVLLPGVVLGLRPMVPGTRQVRLQVRLEFRTFRTLP